MIVLRCAAFAIYFTIALIALERGEWYAVALSLAVALYFFKRAMETKEVQ